MAARRLRRCGCRKTRYPSEGRANTAMRLIRRENPDREELPVRVYPCPQGRGWHLTSQESYGEGAELLRRRPT